MPGPRPWNHPPAPQRAAPAGASAPRGPPCPRKAQPPRLQCGRGGRGKWGLGGSWGKWELLHAASGSHHRGVIQGGEEQKGPVVGGARFDGKRRGGREKEGRACTNSPACGRASAPPLPPTATRTTTCRGHDLLPAHTVRGLAQSHTPHAAPGPAPGPEMVCRVGMSSACSAAAPTAAEAAWMASTAGPNASSTFMPASSSPLVKACKGWRWGGAGWGG